MVLGSDPGKSGIPRLKTPTIKNAPRPVLRQLKNGPLTMKLYEAATGDGPQETGSATGLRWADWVGANGTLANGI